MLRGSMPVGECSARVLGSCWHFGPVGAKHQRVLVHGLLKGPAHARVLLCPHQDDAAACLTSVGQS